MFKKTLFCSFIASTIFFQTVQACTRAVYLGNNDHTITARSMDWKVDVGTNLWIMPSGVNRDSNAGPKSLKWKAKYGSVIATGYDISTTDGMNEAGLVANVLWLVESQYPDTKQSNKPQLSISAWAQYALDNFSTVSEAVSALEKEPFDLITDSVPGEQRLATLHLSLSDKTGDSAIIEYINGKQVIHHDKKYQVMTNSPTFDQQLALNSYWQQIGGTVMLPGTNRAADRFARASFYINAIPKNDNAKEAIASVFSVIRNASVPYGLNTAEEPNISSTRWRTVADHKQQLYFFESAVSPNVFWVDLKKINFKNGVTRKLDLGKDQQNSFAGDATDQFKIAKPFEFLGPAQHH
ncbi:linear amide C-N hydrolase [Acinetobacter corruptisaponis]|uniref:Linear amide C-N hydrolase n=1 Tax=Acinetobacter corruptisaponis TaxID=3045147 RepID=A0ABY8S4J2_9GAMM|nr:linear amide C-N hydrolase [Acinetobacter sp. KCTC 92772]WHP06316.1 linear amide C-N hydrolase [Acinetobacter sp. KCTC 92772]